MSMRNQIEEEKDEGVLLRSHRYMNFDAREIEEDFDSGDNEEEGKDDKSNVSLVDSEHEEEKEVAANNAPKKSRSVAIF